MGKEKRNNNKKQPSPTSLAEEEKRAQEEQQAIGEKDAEAPRQVVQQGRLTQELTSVATKAPTTEHGIQQQQQQQQCHHVDGTPNTNVSHRLLLTYSINISILKVGGILIIWKLSTCDY
jgi:hypothetical protein